MPAWPKENASIGSQVAQPQRKCHDTLRTYLEELRNEDPRCIFITRRINKLGFRSKSILENHYSKYGEVTQVLVAHSKVKPFRNSGTVPRTRPGNFGLIVMRSPEVVRRILAEGQLQSVRGVDIQAVHFEHVRACGDAEGEAEEDGPEDAAGSAAPASAWGPDEAEDSAASGTSRSRGADAGERAREACAPEWHSLHSLSTACRSSSGSGGQACSSDQSSQGSQASQASQAPPPPAGARAARGGGQAPAPGGAGTSARHLPRRGTGSAREAAAPQSAQHAALGRQAEAFSDAMREQLRMSNDGCMDSNMSSLFGAMINELSAIANNSQQVRTLTRNQTMQAAALAQSAQESLRRLEEQCQQRIMQLLDVQPPMPAVPAVPFATPHVQALASSHPPVPQVPLGAEAPLMPVPHVPPAPGLVPLQPPRPFEGGAVPAAVAVQQPGHPGVWPGPPPPAEGPPAQSLPPLHQVGGLTAAELGLAGSPLAGLLPPLLPAEPPCPAAPAAAAARGTAGPAAGAGAGASASAGVGGGASGGASSGAGTAGGAAPRAAPGGASPPPRQGPLCRGHARSQEDQEGCAGQRETLRCDTLRSHLTELSTEDPACIFITRRINKLGFRSREVLYQHFSHYGDVLRVLVAHSKVQGLRKVVWPVRDSGGQLRTRPGGLGLIVMRKAVSVRHVLSLGEEQMVAGHQIRVQCFERPKVETSCSGTSTSTGLSGGKPSRGMRSQRSSATSPEKSEEGGSSEPTEKCDADVGSSGPESSPGSPDSSAG